MSQDTPDEGPKVVVHEYDHAAEQAKRLEREAKENARTVRAGYVAGLENELAYLERQPEPNKRRIADVKDQLEQYAEKPAKREREAAVPQGSPTPPPATQSGEPAQTPAPAKKAAAKKAPAKKAAPAVKK